MLLISDLHLETGRPDITATLVDFLRNRATGSNRLYILGDLFEVWIGDDAADSLADRVATELTRLAGQGVEILILHGNRDFLLGTDFAARCGARLIDEPHILTINGQRLALLHGDILCTRDTEYQQFRRLVRNPDWQAQFLAQPLEKRREFARQARQQSQQATAVSEAAIMDVTDSAVTDLFGELNVQTIIHGHTHRPAIHELRVDLPGAEDCQVRRVVLGDWDKQGWFGRIDDDGAVSLHQMPLMPPDVSS